MNRLHLRRAGTVTAAVSVLFLITLLYYSTSGVSEFQELSYSEKDSFSHDYFKPSDKVITPIDESYLIKGEAICKGVSEKTVIILIPSVTKDLATRNLLRRTWVGALKRDEWPGERLQYTYRAAFIFGKGSSEDSQALLMENSIYGDIVQGSFTDSYFNLTRKTLFGLKWVTKFCPDARYVLKIDVDSFAHVPQLLKKVSVYNDGVGKILGRLWEKTQPHRSGKWKIGVNDYPANYYPPYCDGPIYVISAPALPAIVHIAERMPYLQLEDVFVTGIVATIANVNRINILPNVDFRNHPEPVCNFRMAGDRLPEHLADSDYNSKQITAIWRCMVEGPKTDQIIAFYFHYYKVKLIRIESLYILSFIAVFLFAVTRLLK